MTGISPDSLSISEKAEAALRDAARKVHEEARRTGGTVAVWRNGRVEEIPADQLPADLDLPQAEEKGPTE